MGSSVCTQYGRHPIPGAAGAELSDCSDSDSSADVEQAISSALSQLKQKHNKKTSVPTVQLLPVAPTSSGQQQPSAAPKSTSSAVFAKSNGQSGSSDRLSGSTRGIVTLSRHDAVREWLWDPTVVGIAAHPVQSLSPADSATPIAGGPESAPSTM